MTIKCGIEPGIRAEELKIKRDILRAQVEGSSAQATQVLQAKINLVALAILRVEAYETAKASMDAVMSEVESHV